VEEYKRWEILLAWMPSSDDEPPPYPHYCVYLGLSPKYPGKIIVLGITSDLSRRVPGYSTDLPWKAGKHPITGLDRPSLAQALWIKHIAPALVTKVTGFVEPREQLSIAVCIDRRIKENK
jgi:hypothetical protein